MSFKPWGWHGLGVLNLGWAQRQSGALCLEMQIIYHKFKIKI
jgi:hypothetical protein